MHCDVRIQRIYKRKPEVNVIQFSLNGQTVQVTDIDPNMTVLRYLRTVSMHSATKEGCAGGDCGACSILVAEEAQQGQLRFQAINACIALLGSLDGKTIFTVEALKVGDHLHPVQQAMVDYHGAQCGFCTPGIVASLAALYHNKGGAQATDEEIHEALSGNLCRCTGYRPIIDAAKAMNAYPAPSQDSPASSTGVVQFDPCAPNSLEQAAVSQAGKHLFIPETEGQLSQLLKDYPDATLWAGGTDLGLELTQQFKRFDVIISLHKLASLTKVTETDDDISFGAMVTYSDAEAHLAKQFPAFAQLIQRIAARQIRNLGTLGGNVANASPIGDTPPVFLALNARVELASINGKREVALDDFFKGYKVTDLQKGEYLRQIIVPKLTAQQSLHVFKVSKRKEDDISAVLAGVRIEHDGSNITDARIAFGGMAATPLRAVNTEKDLMGKPFELSSFEHAAEHIQNDYSPMKDVRATAEYRLNVASNLIIKTGLEIFEPESLTQGGHA